MLKKIISLVCGVVVLAMPTNAFAFRANHKGMSELRPVLGGDAYFSQQVQYSQTQATLGGKEGQNALLQGYALRAAVGLEHMHFLQTGVFFSSVTENMRTGSRAEFRSMEFGAEAKLVFTGPLANLCLGGGAVASQGSYRNGLEFGSTAGNGYFGVAEVVYFMSSRLSFNVSTSSHWMDQTVRGASFNSVTSQGLRGGAGFSIWL